MSIEKNGLVTNRSLYQFKKVILHITDPNMAWHTLVRGFAPASESRHLEALCYGGFDKEPMRIQTASRRYVMVRPISPNRKRETFPYQETRDFILTHFPALRPTSPRDLLLFARRMNCMFDEYMYPDQDCPLWDLGYERYLSTRATCVHPEIGREVVRVDVEAHWQTKVEVIPDLVMGPTRDWLLFIE